MFEKLVFMYDISLLLRVFLIFFFFFPSFRVFVPLKPNVNELKHFRISKKIAFVGQLTSSEKLFVSKSVAKREGN